MLFENKELFCDKHQISFNGKLLFGEVKLGCPMCNKESQEARIELETREKIAREKELNEYKDFRIKHSGLSKKLIEIKAKYTPNFKAFSEHLISLKTNLFICGSVGVGKSVYCAELIKRNTEKYPRYYTAIELSYLTKPQKATLLNGISNCELIVIDEIGDFSAIDEQFFNALIDKLYNQGAFFVLCGNVELRFLNNFGAKVLSRLNSNGLSVCEFIGQDLRLNQV